MSEKKTKHYASEFKESAVKLAEEYNQEHKDSAKKHIIMN